MLRENNQRLGIFPPQLETLKLMHEGGRAEHPLNYFCRLRMDVIVILLDDPSAVF